MNTKKQRFSGILVHPTSFPSPYGIGDLGQGAYDFIDFLANTGQHLWQVLPLGPTGYGDSPYQGFSAFAGQPLLISPADLQELGLLTDEHFAEMPVWNDRRIDYGSVIEFKTQLFHAAFAVFQQAPNHPLTAEFEEFCLQSAAWLADYALFMGGKDAHAGRCWLEWEDSLKNPTAESKRRWETSLKTEIKYYKFLQFLFYRQWNKLKSYANEQGISIVGDIPIFVAMDSADVWANKELFQLDEDGYPTQVAGVPPDYFSASGQLWGNPLYDWKAHKAQDYAWWIARIKHQIGLTDYLRIDHFRGFESYWSVPAEEETAINGKWVSGPREDLFLEIEKELGSALPIFAEDLGIITPEVEQLRDRFAFPGMRILQFAFQGLDDSVYLPHNFNTTNCICYSGTHDNDTTAGWFQMLSHQEKDRVRRYANTDGNCISLDFIRLCLGTVAKYAIFPIQDLLQLGSEDRMNTPGVAANNWAFRYEYGDLNKTLANWLKQTTDLFGR